MEQALLKGPKPNFYTVEMEPYNDSALYSDGVALQSETT